MKRHDLDLLSLVFGIVFVLVGAIGLADRFVPTVADLRWLVPASLIVLGLVLVLPAGLRRGSGSAASATDAPTDEGAEVVGDGDAR